jgi:membrane protease YdiL (CAAX protease family)
LKEVWLVAGAVTATYAFAFRAELAGTQGFLWAFGLPHLLLAAYALRALSRDGTLGARLAPRFGDLSLGVLTAAVLLVGSWGARAVLVPTGTPRTMWLLVLYAQLGDPEVLQRSLLWTGLLIGITLAEEIVWRGLVLDRLTHQLGTRRGWMAAAGLYAFASLPTVYTLRVANVGPNPLLFFAALGCGLVWTYLTARSGRLWPSAVSHAAFSYFSAVQFRMLP